MDHKDDELINFNKRKSLIDEFIDGGWRKNFWICLEY